MGGTRRAHEDDEKFIRNFSRKHEGRRVLEIRTRRWEDNIKMVKILVEMYEVKRTHLGIKQIGGA